MEGQSLSMAVEEEAGQGKTSEWMQPQAVFGYCVVRAEKGERKRRRDYVKAAVRRLRKGGEGSAAARGAEEEVALFGVFDDHGGGDVGRKLAATLFDSITNEGGVWSDPAGATRDAYLRTDRRLLAGGADGGATAVTAMLLHAGARLIVANVGDARAVLCKDGAALQLSVDHSPARAVERASVEMRGGVVTTFPGDLPRVDGLVSVTRGFGDAGVKEHMSAKPDVCDVLVDISCEFLVLGSKGLWAAYSSNQEAVDLVKGLSDPLAAAKLLARQARARGSGEDEISCIVIRFREL